MKKLFFLALATAVLVAISDPGKADFPGEWFVEARFCLHGIESASCRDIVLRTEAEVNEVSCKMSSWSLVFSWGRSNMPFDFRPVSWGCTRTPRTDT